jgi:hypothetical protein
MTTFTKGKLSVSTDDKPLTVTNTVGLTCLRPHFT